jgi:hypothetical protein
MIDTVVSSWSQWPGGCWMRCRLDAAFRTSLEVLVHQAVEGAVIAASSAADAVCIVRCGDAQAVAVNPRSEPGKARIDRHLQERARGRPALRARPAAAGCPR